jgi:hypothetical protein
VTALAILFLLSSMALWSTNQLRHPAGVMVALGALLVLGLALLME